MKKPGLKPVTDPRGFTLLEILLAIVILGTVLSTVFASYTSTFRIIKDIESQLEIYQMARMALDRMVEDLESVYVPSEAFGGEEDEIQIPPWHAFEGEENGINGENADTLRFSSGAHIHFGPKNESAGTAMITYYVEEVEGTEGLVLLRRDQLLMNNPPGEEPDDEIAGFPLCEGLVSVDFKYLNLDGEEQETWSIEENDELPIMVFITLEFINPSDSENHYKFATMVGLPASDF